MAFGSALIRVKQFGEKVAAAPLTRNRQQVEAAIGGRLSLLCWGSGRLRGGASKTPGNTRSRTLPASCCRLSTICVVSSAPARRMQRRRVDRAGLVDTHTGLHRGEKVLVFVSPFD